MLIDDLNAGRMVEFDGELYLIEDMSITLTMQRIEPMKPFWDELISTGEGHTHNPLFMQLSGRAEDAVFSDERFKLLFRADEL